VRSLNLLSEQNSLREHVRQAARLRENAASATTARIKVRLLEEAANQERLAEEIKAGRGVTTPARVPAERPLNKSYRRDLSFRLSSGRTLGREELPLARG
jgi:hypothetical protein